MIEIKKKKINKRSLPIIITSAILVLLIAGLIVTNTIISSLSGDGKKEEEKPDYIPEIGESYYGSSALAYPSFLESEVSSLVVGSHSGKYFMSRSGSYFIIGTYDENGNPEHYIPDILYKESGFNYSNFYALDESGMGFKFNYLFATLGTLMIDQRIALSSDSDERAKQLDRYGLSDGEKEVIIITKTIKGETEEQTKKEEITIEIGDKLLAGTGYYYRVNGRDYVYTSSGTYLTYALNGFETFVSPNLIAPGIAGDNTSAPYFTPDYKQWKNKITRFDKELDASLQALVKANSKVIGKVTSYTPVDDEYYKDNELDPAKGNGYSTGVQKSHSFDLYSLSAFPQYSRLVQILTSHRLGDYTDRELLATISTRNVEIEFGESDSVTYDYKILKIESVLTSDGEFAEGYGYERVKDVAGATMIKVAYDYYVGGTKKNVAQRHAVVELADLDADTLALISEARIGAEVSIDFKYNYDKSVADSQRMSYVISEITSILDEDENGGGKIAEKVGENSFVTYEYYYTYNGERVSESQSVKVQMSELKEGNELKIKAVLLGRSAESGLNLVAYEDVRYTQIMQSFVTYSFASLDYFVESELLASFEFVNNSNRDPFVSGSLYINTLPASNKYSTYALNSTACEQIVTFLGGIGRSSSSEQEGLSGSEVVALGVNPENMDKYGLYANTIYYELPRYIIDLPSDDDDSVPDVTSLSTLGFTLYVSDYNPEERCRYVASDLYDVVVKMEDDGFDYLDLSFTDYFARRNLMLIKYTDIESMTLNFNFEDFYGSYTLDAECTKVWASGGEIYLTKPENISAKQVDYLTVEAYVNGANSGNKLTEYITSDGKPSLDLGKLYNRVASEALGREVSLTVGNSTLGAASFQDMLSLMFNTYYLGALTPEEQAEGFKTEKLMSLSVKVKETETVKSKTYTYDFYRIDDRRVMVSLYNEGYDNAVSDFYITAPAFKKIVNNFDNLFNGIRIDADEMYD